MLSWARPFDLNPRVAAWTGGEVTDRHLGIRVALGSEKLTVVTRTVESLGLCKTLVCGNFEPPLNFEIVNNEIVYRNRVIKT